MSIRHGPRFSLRLGDKKTLVYTVLIWYTFGFGDLTTVSADVLAAQQ